jgi:hypothetical protein
MEERTQWGRSAHLIAARKQRDERQERGRAIEDHDLQL